MKGRQFLSKVFRRHSSNSVYLKEKEIATIPKYLHEYLFRTEAPITAVPCKVKLELPALQGNSLQDHFGCISDTLVGEYFKLLEEGTVVFEKNVELPKTWQMKTGWLRYTRDGRHPEPVPYPLEDVFVFDVETCVSRGQLPTLAVAISSEAVYGWCSEFLLNDSKYPEHTRLKHLIPLGGKDISRIAIGHNVGYDRVRSQEPYHEEDSAIRFMDTMSMWIPISGMADHQRSMYEVDDLVLAEELMTYCAMDCVATGKIYSKLWPKFKERFPSLVTLYGFLNVGNAYLPINRQWNDFFKVNEETCENKKVTAAQAIVTCAKLLIEENSNGSAAQNDPWMWQFDWSLDKKQNHPGWFYKLFRKRALVQSDISNLVSEDVVTKSAMIPAIFGMTYGPYPVYKSKSHGWGFLVPTSIRKTVQDQDEDFNIPSDSIQEFVEKNMKISKKVTLPLAATVRFRGCDFYKLPHPSGRGNVGDILSKMFASELDEKLLKPSRYQDQFEKVLMSLRSTRFWTSYRERYHSEIPVWYEKEVGTDNDLVGAIAPAIVPAGTVSRRSVHKLWVTLTNSAVTPPGFKLVGADVDSQEQWLAGLFGDASAAKSLPISERRAGVTPFSEMMLVGTKSNGTDLHTVVAKQLGISRHNAKILNYARLYGSGERHAELFLIQSGVSAQNARIISKNLFALTKGTLSRWHKLNKVLLPLVHRFNNSGGKLEFIGFGGDFYVPAYSNLQCDTLIDFEKYVTESLRSQDNCSIGTEDIVQFMYENSAQPHFLYNGGYESATFNFLEQESQKKLLRTPILNCQLGDSLAQLPDEAPDRDRFNFKYRRSVMNWLVQSSAVDFLHLLLVCMEWLCNEYSIKHRFVISIHDEIRYLCPEEEASRLGLALMLSNLYVRAYITEKVGISQLPETIAFFSQVDCDKVLRKEVDSPFTNPDGSTVENGVAWTFEDLLKHNNGTLRKIK
ncbi:unnamed protein product [Auanema sp. JU1783]|nr:unnamed protein product [Auanema sp. JU1783]